MQHNRITQKQLELLEGMAKQLLNKRLHKALERRDSRDLLPEEKHLYQSYSDYQLDLDRFLGALVNGQPSLFAVMQKQQMQRMVTVRFVKPLGEVIGFDLNRYGPFRVHDLARLPTGNADALIANGEAVQVYADDSI